MRILHVHDRWSARGGADWHLLSLLAASGSGIGSIGLFGRSDGSVPDGLAPTEGLHFIKHLDRSAPFASETGVGEQVLDLVRTLRPDLIHVHNVLNPHLGAILASTGAPSIMTVQDHRAFCPGRGKVRADGSLCNRVFGPRCAGCFEDEFYFKRLLALVQARIETLSAFDALIVLSRYMKAELAAAGLDAQRIHVIPPFPFGLAPDFTPASAGEDMLFVGRIVWTKGIFDLLDALTRVEGRARLVIAGAGTMDEPLAARTREMGLEDRIEFTGWVSHPDMAACYRRARLVVMPSRWQEPFGIVGIEALALGRPVLAYDVGGVRDWLIDGVTGLLVPAGRTDSLASDINSLLGDPKRAETLGRAGRESTLRRFDRRVLMDRIENLYRQIIRGGEIVDARGNTC